MTADCPPTKESAIVAAARELEISQQTVAGWMTRGVLEWAAPGVINPRHLEHASEVLHGIYGVTRGWRRGDRLLETFISKIPQHELAHDEVFLAHWQGTRPERCLVS
jgi:hypothetical protein